MQRIKKRSTIRNKINLIDPAQVRAWTRRLGLPEDELKLVVEKVGNSVTAVVKEIELQQISRQPADTSIPSSTGQLAANTLPERA
jgi:hypothetical protein